MKRSLAVALILALTSAMNWAQSTETPKQPTSIKDQLAALETEAAPLLALRDANKKVLTSLNQTYDDINSGIADLTKSGNNYKTDLAAYTVDLGAFGQAVDD